MQLSISVAYGNTQRQLELPLLVEEGCTVREAILRSRIFELFPELSVTQIENGVFSIGIHGQRTALNKVLCHDDRVEIYRPLLADPKEVRRLLSRKKSPK